MHFPVAGIDVHPLIPFFVALGVSFFTSMGGVSGAFLLLPFQISVLGFTSPSVSSTNLVYNIIAIPSGIYRYIKEGRMAWPLVWIIIAGTLPGVFLGVTLRVKYLPDPKHFKFFVGCVLIYIGIRLLHDLAPKSAAKNLKAKELERRFNERFRKIKTAEKKTTIIAPSIKTVRFSFRQYEFLFYGESFSFNPCLLFFLTLVVGIIGGTYGIGGGAIIAPFLVTIFGLPVYAVAGAALSGTLITSIVGLVYYNLVSSFYAVSGLSIEPDWMLGGIFGMGGFIGMYCGAVAQKYMPAKIIKFIIGISIVLLSIRYISGIFL